MTQERIIGIYPGTDKGPLVVCLGGIHGNEPAGVEALVQLIQRLSSKTRKNPDFRFRGTLLALRGNLAALQHGVRYLYEDLNRAWKPTRIPLLLQQPRPALHAEEREIAELLHHIQQAIDTYQPDSLFLIDLHTSSAKGGIFCLPGSDEYSRHIAAGIHAPAVHGMLETIEGSALEYFLEESHFGIPVSGLAFEAGQHENPESPRRALAAVINCLRALGCVRPADVHNEHDQLLRTFSEGIPLSLEIIWRHHIEPDDQFHMLPGFHNFDPVKAGQALAQDCNGTIRAATDARILMPLYQSQGEDGFFLVREKP